jgi:hypothetical protein
MRPAVANSNDIAITAGGGRMPERGPGRPALS